MTDVDSVKVFNKECVRVTSDKELDDLGLNVVAIKSLDAKVYIYKERGVIIEVVYCDEDGWTLRLTSTQDKLQDIFSESFDTLKEAELDMIDNIQRYKAAIDRLNIIVSM